MLLRTTLTLAALSFATTGFAMSDVDSNADKMLSLEETKAAYPEISEDQFILADVNNDGMLTEEELVNAVKAGVLPDISG